MGSANKRESEDLAIRRLRLAVQDCTQAIEGATNALAIAAEDSKKRIEEAALALASLVNK